ncbi:MAG: HD domain-containing protein, partial [Halieaceae bacterium]|nr:HD domain-containing protein [Halieaceae bacterium]
MDAQQQYDPARLEECVSRLGDFSHARFLENRDIYQSLLDRVCDFAGTEHGQIYAYDDETELLTFLAASESCVVRCPLPADRHLPLSATGHWTDCLRDKRVLCYEPYIPTRATHEPPSGWRNLVGIPLLLDGARGGLIIIGDPLATTPSFLEDLNYFVDRAYSIAHGHEAALKREELGIVRGYYESSPLKVLIDMLTAIGEAVEIRDLYTANHQKNVAMICGHIADQLGLGEFRKAGLIAGASIHDIGKLSVPVELLTKPGKLLTPEWLLIQEHSATGGSIMHDLSMPWPI